MINEIKKQISEINNIKKLEELKEYISYEIECLKKLKSIGIDLKVLEKPKIKLHCKKHYPMLIGNGSYVCRNCGKFLRWATEEEIGE